MTNFDFLNNEEQFESFANTAIVAEQLFQFDYASSVVNCRRALEFAIKWLYATDTSLKRPYQETLITLLSTDEFKDLVGTDILKRINYIRTSGNVANHTPRNISKEQALLCLENLFIFMDFIAYLYSAKYEKGKFNKELILTAEKPQNTPKSEEKQILIDDLKTNQQQAETLTNRRIERKDSYPNIPLNPTEAQTRKAYIDLMLADVGWQKGKNWIDEYPIEQMPNASGVGFADYVLFGDDGLPLAVIEAKKTSVDVSQGRQQAKLYADDLERRFGKRPIIFLTNGYETRILIDQENGYPERKISAIYSKADLEKEFYKLNNKTKLTYLNLNNEIADRYYQKEAIKAVCETFAKNRRKALLVMATGSGKTRTIISLVDVLIQNGWVKNFLFLADRNSLVTQAKRSFANLLPEIPLTNLVEDKANYNAKGVFSTYQTMINCIDNICDQNNNKIFTPAHFDLIIIDEAHRSIYNKYKDIFNYFDSLLVGLTATPKNDIDHDTYDTFELEVEVPTYGYDLAQAVKDGYLVNFHTIETKLKFLNEGIVYDDLSEKEKQIYEDNFIDEEGNIPNKINENALNNWVFNANTIRQVLNILMQKGLKVDYGNKIGKTIIFAKNHKHAEEILRIWNTEYPDYPAGFCEVIDNKINYSQSLIDRFTLEDRLPQIAISVDMLDTGIDVPSILNLVFFKKVLSKAKFWQMIGRGTRKCPGLLDGEDKTGFYIFDFCSNFEFFRENKQGEDVLSLPTIQEQLFNLKMNLIFKLQEVGGTSDFLVAFRQELIKDLITQVKSINRSNFAVHQKLQWIDMFIQEETYKNLTYENCLQAQEHIAPIMPPLFEEPSALLFDSLIYKLEYALLSNKPYQRGKIALIKQIDNLKKKTSIQAVSDKFEYINKVSNRAYLDKAGICELEDIRNNLRDLMKYLDKKERKTHKVDFIDSFIESLESDADLGDELINYKNKVNQYIREHQDNPAISKLKTNKPLNKEDIDSLERILWSEVGTKDDYKREFGTTPFGELIRSIVGLDRQAAKEEFSKFIDEANLNQRQIHFVNEIIEYIVQNGLMKDLSVLQNAPFVTLGNVSEVFQDNNIWMGIRKAISSINNNAIT